MMNADSETIYRRIIIVTMGWDYVSVELDL
jgi:hypothetical protein